MILFIQFIHYLSTTSSHTVHPNSNIFSLYFNPFLIRSLFTFKWSDLSLHLFLFSLNFLFKWPLSILHFLDWIFLFFLSFQLPHLFCPCPFLCYAKWIVLPYMYQPSSSFSITVSFLPFSLSSNNPFSRVPNYPSFPNPFIHFILLWMFPLLFQSIVVVQCKNE